MPWALEGPQGETFLSLPHRPPFLPFSLPDHLALVLQCLIASYSFFLLPDCLHASWPIPMYPLLLSWPPLHPPSLPNHFLVLLFSLPVYLFIISLPDPAPQHFSLPLPDQPPFLCSSLHNHSPFFPSPCLLISLLFLAPAWPPHNPPSLPAWLPSIPLFSLADFLPFLLSLPHFPNRLLTACHVLNPFFFPVWSAPIPFTLPALFLTSPMLYQPSFIYFSLSDPPSILPLLPVWSLSVLPSFLPDHLHSYIPA